MSLSDRILSGLKTVILIEERVTALGTAIKELKTTAEAKLADHESRLTRLETIIEIVKPDRGSLRIAPPTEAP